MDRISFWSVFSKWAAGFICAAMLATLLVACNSGPKVYNIGNSASRVTIQTAD